MQAKFKNILYEEGAGRVTITINRPPLNLIDLETFEEMQKALREARSVSGLKALVLTGSGEQAFSAGITIESFYARTDPELHGDCPQHHRDLGGIGYRDHCRHPRSRPGGRMRTGLLFAISFWRTIRPNSGSLRSRQACFRPWA